MGRRKLLLSIHDVTPAKEDVLREMVLLLEDLGVSEYSMLVIPDYHGGWPVDEYPLFCQWLRELSCSGTEMLLHGYSHLSRVQDSAAVDRMRAALFTRGEGEFLSLDRETAKEILLKGRKMLENVLDIEIKGFVAPAWLYGPGTILALKDVGFTTAENRWRVWNPQTGRNICMVPVANYAGGGPTRMTLAALWVRLYSILAGPLGTARFALHPEDFLTTERRKAVSRTLKRLLKKRQPVSCSDMATVS